MALSVLKIGDGDCYCLFSGDTALIAGSEDEMYAWKETIERAEQQKDNREYMDNLKKERLAMLIEAGNSPEQAEQFLKKQMPYLFQ